MHLERLIMYDYHDCAYYWQRHLKRKARRKTTKSTRLRRIVFVRDGFSCLDCKQVFETPEDWNGENIKGLTLGHIIPKAQGGSRTPENLGAQCEKCNRKLGNNIWVLQLN